MNKVRRRARFDEVTNFNDAMSKVLFDILNEAARDVLETFRHTFDERSDLSIKTFARQTGTTAALSKDSTICTITGYTGEWIGKTTPERFYDATAYIVFTNDSNDASVAQRVVYGSVVGTTLALSIELPWTGDNIVSGTNGGYKLYCFEYGLPKTVRSVISVRDQRLDLRLTHAMSEWQLNELIPRPQDRLGVNPEMIVVTGLRAVTYNTSNSANTGYFSTQVTPAGLGEYAVAP